RAVEEALRESDLLLFMVDAKDGLNPIDEELARLLRKSREPLVLVVNKIDHDKHEALAADFDSLGLDKSVSISAEHNRGISELFDQIEQNLPTTSVGEIKPQTSGFKAPVGIAIVGRPNVGKSSLINAIVQSERAIVSELPGTTRDSVDIFYERD